MNLSVMRTAAVFSIVALTSCGGSDATSPLPGVSASGTYAASIWMTTNGTGQTNQILEGSTINIVFGASGITAGHLHMVASGGLPALDADMAGTWTQQGMTIEIDQPADTFVRDMPFTLTANGDSSWDLEGDKTFNGTQIKLTLSRIGP